MAVEISSSGKQTTNTTMHAGGEELILNSGIAAMKGLVNKMHATKPHYI